MTPAEAVAALGAHLNEADERDRLSHTLQSTLDDISLRTLLPLGRSKAHADARQTPSFSRTHPSILRHPLIRSVPRPRHHPPRPLFCPLLPIKPTRPYPLRQSNAVAAGQREARTSPSQHLCMMAILILASPLCPLTACILLPPAPRHPRPNPRLRRADRAADPSKLVLPPNKQNMTADSRTKRRASSGNVGGHDSCQDTWSGR